MRWIAVPPQPPPAPPSLSPGPCGTTWRAARATHTQLAGHRGRYKPASLITTPSCPQHQHAHRAARQGRQPPHALASTQHLSPVVRIEPAAQLVRPLLLGARALLLGAAVHVLLRQAQQACAWWWCVCGGGEGGAKAVSEAAHAAHPHAAPLPSTQPPTYQHAAPQGAVKLALVVCAAAGWGEGWGEGWRGTLARSRGARASAAPSAHR